MKKKVDKRVAKVFAKKLFVKEYGKVFPSLATFDDSKKSVVREAINHYKSENYKQALDKLAELRGETK